MPRRSNKFITNVLFLITPNSQDDLNQMCLSTGYLIVSRLELFEIFRRGARFHYVIIFGKSKKYIYDSYNNDNDVVTMPLVEHEHDGP